VKKIKTFLKGIWFWIAVILWLIFLPFVLLFDRLFGGWKK